MAPSCFVRNTKEELRVLAAAGGVETHSNRNWLPVAELRRSLKKVLATSTEVGCNKKTASWYRCFSGFLCEIFPTKLK